MVEEGGSKILWFRRGRVGLGLVLTQDSFHEPVKFIRGEILDNEFPALTLGVEGHFGSQTFLQSVFKISPL